MTTTSTAPRQELVAQIVKLHNPNVQSVNVRPYLCLVERFINEISGDNVESHAMVMVYVNGVLVYILVCSYMVGYLYIIVL